MTWKLQFSADVQDWGSVECLECLLTYCGHHLSEGWSGSYTKYWGWRQSAAFMSSSSSLQQWEIINSWIWEEILGREGKGREEKGIGCYDVSGDKSTFQTITWIRNVTKTRTMLCSSMGPPWICFNHLQIILVLVFYHILYNDNTY